MGCNPLVRRRTKTTTTTVRDHNDDDDDPDAPTRRLHLAPELPLGAPEIDPDPELPLGVMGTDLAMDLPEGGPDAHDLTTTTTTSEGPDPRKVRSLGSLPCLTPGPSQSGAAPSF